MENKFDEKESLFAIQKAIENAREQIRNDGFFSNSVGYPFIIILLGWGTVISGGILKFKPLIIGGILAWVIAIADFFVSAENQLLMMALATIIAYLIPGYMLKSKA